MSQADRLQKNRLKRKGRIAVAAIFLSGFIFGGVSLGLAAKSYFEWYLRQPDLIERIVVHIVDKNFDLPPETSAERMTDITELLNQFRILDMMRVDYVNRIMAKRVPKMQKVVPPHQQERYKLASLLFTRNSRHYFLASLYRRLSLEIEQIAEFEDVFAAEFRREILASGPDKEMTEELIRSVTVALVPDLRRLIKPEQQVVLDSLGANLENLVVEKNYREPQLKD